MWINALDLEDEILLTGFENLQFIEVHQFLFGSWITPILLLTQFRACTVSTVKLVKEPCLPLEITLNYLWLLIPAIIINNKSITKCYIGLRNLPWAHSGQFHKPRMMWPVHASMQSRKSLFIHIILGSTCVTSGTLLLYFAT